VQQQCVTRGVCGAAGAHTLGRVKPSRSGFGKEKTKYTEKGPGTPGGSSWTVEWLKFDNSYFKARPSCPRVAVPWGASAPRVKRPGAGIFACKGTALV
jgi:hypothetical protein